MSNELKEDYIDIIEENLAEFVIGVIFIMAFVCSGLMTAYFIATPLIQDIVIALSFVIGAGTLYKKVKG